jgi:hypothetical protein
MWILIPGCQHIYFDDNGGLGNAQCADSQGPYLTMPTVPNTLVIWARDAFGNTVYVILPPPPLGIFRMIPLLPFRLVFV